VAAAIEDGFIQRQIENAAYEYQKEIESGERIIVMINSFQIKEVSRPPTLRVDPAVETMQVEALSQLKKKRNNDKILISLKQLGQAAQTDANLFPYEFAAVKAMSLT
jgi:methylmalonyl-CoA mutase N-terminal domain/subunit